MGYNTRYQLCWDKLPNYVEVPYCDHENKITAKFCSECGRPVGVDSLDSRVATYIEDNHSGIWGVDHEGNGEEPCKWYDHEKDIMWLSKKFPNVLFTLHGKGDESGDVWAKYFVNGEIQREKAELRIGQFDPTKLEPYDDRTSKSSLR